jgi:hypothetical protein
MLSPGLLAVGAAGASPLNLSDAFPVGTVEPFGTVEPWAHASKYCCR